MTEQRSIWVFSTVFDFSYDVDKILSLEEEIYNTTPTEHGFYMHRSDTKDMTQDILMLKDLTCLEKVNEYVAPILLTPEHSIGFENVNPNQKVDLHNDFLFSWNNPFTRKANILFNLNNFPVYIIHQDPKHNKYINPQQIMILDVTKQHGCDHKNINQLTKLFTINIRKTYDDTVSYIQSII